MEHKDEALRLDMKTDCDVVARQATWAGILPGMRVADIGCGSGKTTSCLFELVGRTGECIGVDASAERVAHATATYASEGLVYVQKNILEPLDDLGQFDFIWVRFVLEYFRSRSFDIVSNISKILKPGGILCLIDLDYNCLSHFGMPDRLEQTFASLMKDLEEKADFDPYVGRKLFSYFYDLGFKDINVNVSSHHLIFNELKDVDKYNWEKKVEIATKKINYQFENYPGGYEEFEHEFKTFFEDPRRFTYTPIISCRGRKPSISDGAT